MERRSETIKVHKLKEKVLLYYIDDATGSTQGIDLSYPAYEALARHFGTGALEVCTDEIGDCNMPLVVCSNCPRTIGLTVGKQYKQMAKHGDLIALVNDYGDFKTYNVCYFE